MQNEYSDSLWSFRHSFVEEQNEKNYISGEINQKKVQKSWKNTLLSFR